MKGNVVRWTPFRELNQLQQEMNRLFDGTVLDWRNGEPADVSVWAPLVDILESEDAIVLKAELPEVDPQSVDIRLENNVLTLKGDRQFEGDSQKERFLRSERPYGPFSRSFSMPAIVDEANIKAEFKNGVLTVTLSKKEAAKPKRIQIAA